jgi:Skp family chaperone for outer membrane proteins
MTIIADKARAASLAGAILLAGALATPAMAQQKPAVTPVPRILVLDQSAILQQSKVGQDIVRQRDNFVKQGRAMFQGQMQAIENEGRALQAQLPILSAQAKKQKIQALEAKQRSLQQRAQAYQGQIEGGLIKAQQQVSIALGPILQGILQERGAQLLIDRRAVLMSTVGELDVTGVAIARLNQKMPTVKVSLVNPPQQQKPK